MRGAAALLISSLSTGCAIAELSPHGAQVAVRDVADRNCRSLGTIHASEGGNARMPLTNVKAVKASLRNQAAGLGGDSIVLTNEELGNPLCPNCISMDAMVYRCGAGQPPREARPPAEDVVEIAVSRQRTNPPTEAPESPQPSPRAFSRESALAAMGAAAASAKQCRTPGAPSGEARVHVTFAANGEAVYSDVEGPPFAGTAIGDCIARKFRNTRVPAFEGQPVSMSKTLSWDD